MTRTSELRDLETRMAERRLRGARIWSQAPRRPWEALTPEQPFRSPLRWLAALLLSTALIFGVAAAVVLVPPGLDCRAQSERGFFAGDSISACYARGVATRFAELDGRLRRIILRSGQ